MANCGLLLNDGSSFVLLNDGTSAILLNDNSCAFEPGQSAPVTTATGTGGVGRFPGVWRDYYRSRLPKKKRALADELDEMIAELKARIVESDVSDEDRYDRALRVSQALAQRDDLSAVANARIAEQIDILRRAIQEIDDEEAIILLH